MIKPGSEPKLAPLAAIRSIELREGDAGHATLGNLLVMIKTTRITLAPVTFGPDQRAEGEAFLDKLKRSREAVDPAAAAAAGGSGEELPAMLARLKKRYDDGEITAEELKAEARRLGTPGS